MKKIIYIFSLALIFSSISCKKYVDDYYVDPNGILETVPEQEMLGMMLQNQFFNKADGLRLAMMWMNQATGADRQYKTLDNWNNASGADFDGAWNEAYRTASHADLLEQLANDNANIPTRGIARLYKAWSVGMAASLWGDVPYSQINDIDYPNPIFERQAAVLDSVQALLDRAITDLSGTGISAEKDIYFDGQAYKWAKIAHGLKARFYLHKKDYPNALTEALQGPQSPDDDLMALYDSADDQPYGKYNPMYQLIVIARSGDYDASDAYAITLLGTRNNTKTNDESRKEYNYGGDSPNTAIGATGTGKFYGNMPMVTYGEMLLIATEATLRDNTKSIDDALVYYNQYRDLLATGYDTGGYPGAQYDPYVATDFDAGGMENGDSINPRKAFFREIFEERYLFFIGDYEAFIDHARSFNDPDVPQYMELQDYDNQPLRFVYPQVEEDANPNFPGHVDINVPLPLYN